VTTVKNETSLKHSFFRSLLDEDIAFIGKPFTSDALVRKVVEVLRHKPTSTQSIERIPSTEGGSRESEVWS
jgi:hypothetical protein